MTHSAGRWNLSPDHHQGTGPLRYPRTGDRYYKVTAADKDEAGHGRIRAAVGLYRNAPNAIFGLMRRMRLDREDPALVQVWCELLPPRRSDETKAGYMRRLRRQHESF